MRYCANIHQEVWQVLARLADICQALLRGLARLADIRQAPKVIFEENVTCLAKLARVAIA